LKDRVSKLHERAGPLLSLLYATPGDPDAASRFVRALCAEISEDVRAVGLARTAADPSGMLVAFGIGGWRADGVDLDIPIGGEERGIERLPLGAVFEIPGPDPAFARSPLFQKLLEPMGVRPGPGLGMVQERDDLRVTLALLLLPADGHWKPAPRDLELLEYLAPHLLQSLRLHARLTEASTGANALVAAFDQLVLGVVLLDQRSRVTFANQSAAAVLGVEPGLTEPERMTTDPRTAALGRLLMGEGQPMLGKLILRHPEDERPLQIFSTALAWPARYGEAARRFATAVFIGDAGCLTGDPIGILGELYGLTPSEARLAMLLVADRSIEQAARHLGTTLNTTRSVLKNVFAKTGTNRQASLVRLLLAGPGQLRVPEARPGPTRPAPPRKRAGSLQ